MKEIIVTYEPDNSLKKGYLSIFCQIFIELKQNRWLTYQLFKRDFLSAYKQSFFGVAWSILIPLMSVYTFILLNRSGLFLVGDTKLPYPIYALWGMAFWQLFSAGLIASSNSLIKAGSMILKINFSKKSLVLAAACQSTVPFLTLLILLGFCYVWYGIPPRPECLLIPVIVLPIFLLTLGLGFILALLNGIIRDIGNVVAIFLTFLMFLTPVLYVKPSEGILAKITLYNPLYYLTSIPRDLFLKGTILEWEGFLISSALSIQLFLVCLVGFHLTETRVAERI